MVWSSKYKKSIDCDNPKGFSQRAHCQGRAKKSDVKEESLTEAPRIARKPGQPAGSKKHSDLYTDENPKGTIHGLGFKDVATAKQSVTKIRKSGRSHAHKIQAAIAMEQRARAAGKSSEAAVFRSFIDSMKEKTKQMNEEGLRDWFGKSKSKDGKGGWVNVVTGGTCASDEPGEGTPKCVSSAKRASMTKAERLSAARRKKAADPGQQQKSGAAKPTYVSTDSPSKKKKKKMKEELNIQEESDKKGKGSGTKDACYHKVKSRYSVWPSAYASGALVKCRKVGAANWGNKSEEWAFEFNDNYHRDLIEKCWPGYEKKGMKTMFGKRYPNCVKKEEVEIQEKIERYNEIGQTVMTMIRWRGKYYKLQFFFPGPKFPTRKEVTVQVQKFYPDAVVMSHAPSETDPTEPTIRVAEETLPDGPAPGMRNTQKPKKNPQGGDKRPGLVERILEQLEDKERKGSDYRGRDYGPKKPDVKIPLRGVMQSPLDPVKPKLADSVESEGEQLDEVAAWQRSEGKKKSGGLNEKGRKSYERENPGSDLKAPSKKVGNPRRASFCARMKGMKKKLTSAKTANDPDSRINKSLRAWNC